MEYARILALVFIAAASFLLTDAARLQFLESGLASADVAANYWKQALAQESVPDEIFRLLPLLSAADASRLASSISNGRVSEQAAARFCSSPEVACADDAPFVRHIAVSGSLVWYYGPANEGPLFGRTMQKHDHSNHVFFREHQLTDEGFLVKAADAIANWALRRPFIPREVEEALRLAPGGPETALRMDGGSRVGKSMRVTRHFCDQLQAPQLVQEKWWQGEAACVFSAEDLTDFAASQLVEEVPVHGGVEALPGTDLDAVSLEKEAPDATFRVAKVELRKDVAGSFVACHVLPFAYQAMLCHSQPSSKLYWVTLESTAQPGTTVTELAVCHMDTSSWSPDHPSFTMMGSKPGQSEACHWANFGFLALFRANHVNLPSAAA